MLSSLALPFGFDTSLNSAASVPMVFFRENRVCEERYYDPMSPLSIIGAQREENVIVIHRNVPLNLTTRTKAMSLFGDMAEFDEDEWKRYGQMLDNDSVILENVF